jgi:hypothetical protein
MMITYLNEAKHMNPHNQIGMAMIKSMTTPRHPTTFDHVNIVVAGTAAVTQIPLPTVHLVPPNEGAEQEVRPQQTAMRQKSSPTALIATVDH